jgi:hypothetical protein
MSTLKQVASLLNDGRRRRIVLGVPNDRKAGAFDSRVHRIPMKRARDKSPSPVRLALGSEHLCEDDDDRNGDPIIREDIVLGRVSNIDDLTSFQRSGSVQHVNSQETDSSSSSASSTSGTPVASEASTAVVSDDLVRHFASNAQMGAPINIAVGPGGQLFAIVPTAVAATTHAVQSSSSVRRISSSRKRKESQTVRTVPFLKILRSIRILPHDLKYF